MRVDIGAQRIHWDRFEEVGGLDHAVPAKRVDHVRVCRQPSWLGIVIQERTHRADCAAMLIIAVTPDHDQQYKAGNRSPATVRTFAARPNFLVDQAEQRRHSQAGDQSKIQITGSMM